MGNCYVDMAYTEKYKQVEAFDGIVIDAHNDLDAGVDIYCFVDKYFVGSDYSMGIAGDCSIASKDYPYVVVDSMTNVVYDEFDMFVVAQYVVVEMSYDA